MRKILIVEDETSLLKALIFKLSKYGYDISIAYDGEEAVGALAQTKFDILLLDIALPGLDGAHVLNYLHTQNHYPHIFVLSDLPEAQVTRKINKFKIHRRYKKSLLSLSELTNHIEDIWETQL